MFAKNQDACNLSVIKACFLMGLKLQLEKKAINYQEDKSKGFRLQEH